MSFLIVVIEKTNDKYVLHAILLTFLSIALYVCLETPIKLVSYSCDISVFVLSTVRFGVGLAIRPVSYTHLDVYKRQR